MSEEHMQRMQRMEALIFALAQIALQRAYCRALATSGVVLQALRRQLPKISADGATRVIRNIAKPTAVIWGARRLRGVQGVTIRN